METPMNRTLLSHEGNLVGLMIRVSTEILEGSGFNP